ncbi:MAG TPA: FTR1 family protein [Patescibacteria group bacterium]
MIATFILSFREFLEAFLLVGLFLGVSKKLNLGRTKEILFASGTGLLLSLILPTLVFIFGSDAQKVVTEKNADLLEGYLLTFSGIFIAYVVFSIHKMMKETSKNWANKIKTQLVEKEIFDITLFATITLFIAREGFEIALLTATTSLFTVFAQNVLGLLLGFLGGAIIGSLVYFSLLKISISRVFQITEYAIVIFGAAMMKNGISNLVANYSKIKIENIIPLHLSFLPGDNTIFGHVVKNLFGFEKEFSIASLFIMAAYIVIMYIFFLHKKPASK